MGKVDDIISKINTFVAETHFGFNIINNDLDNKILKLRDLSDKVDFHIFEAKNTLNSATLINESLNEINKDVFSLKKDIAKLKIFNIRRFSFYRYNTHLKNFQKVLYLLSNNYENMSNELNKLKNLSYILLILLTLNIIFLLMVIMS